MAKKTFQDYGREWLDTLVVAISVAMAFRAYFFEPFNIPTGSMQPTLYGNHSEVCSQKSFWDVPVLSGLKFLLSGETYKEFRAPWGGELWVGARGDGNVDLFVRNALHPVSDGGPLRIVEALLWENQMDCRKGLCRLPTDALGKLPFDGRKIEINHCYNPAPVLVDGKVMTVKKDDLVWRGTVVKGDFIFVNRWKWNFFRPARGEVMIFSTTGISALPQGTHYIKRMTGLPGETIEIRKPDVYVDGQKIPPLKPMTGKNGELTPLPNPGNMSGPFKLGERQYFACGDNSDNSADSRYWGAVPAENLRGCASIVFWPIVNRRWGNIK